VIAYKTETSTASCVIGTARAAIAGLLDLLRLIDNARNAFA
jgi:hypothetical protein